MDSLHTLAVKFIGPVVDVLESFSWIGVSTHFVKHAVLVSEYIFIYKLDCLIPMYCLFNRMRR